MITNLLRAEDTEHPLSADVTIELFPVTQAEWVVILHSALQLKEPKICLQGSLQHCNYLKLKHVKKAVFYVFLGGLNVWGHLGFKWA